MSDPRLGWAAVVSGVEVLSPGCMLESSGQFKKSWCRRPASGHLIQNLWEVEPGVSGC